jgi:predicted metal-binding membrane protein
MGLAAPLFLAIWVVMMVAMMFPTAAPMILVFHQVEANRRQRGEAFVATWVFVAAYLCVWSLAGVVAFAGAVLAESLTRSAGLSADAAARIGGALLIIAGLYQLSPLKSVCLSKCRSPITFIMTSWRNGLDGAMRMGIEHGLYCLGCCWLLFVILFPLGIMNVAAMAAITALIFAEKAFPWGVRVAQIAASALVLYGVVVLFVPSILPTSVTEQSMDMLVNPAPSLPKEPRLPDKMPDMKM